MERYLLVITRHAIPLPAIFGLVIYFFAGFANAQISAQPQHVVLISIDGFRHDYIELHQAKNLAKLAANGVRAAQLTPVYPSKTFPNHLSLITGLLPVNHGIVNNAFLDKQREKNQQYARYSMGKGYRDSTWISGLPLWNLVEMHGYKAAAYFWPESDARINGLTPSYFYHYSQLSNYENRIKQIIQWLQLPEHTRPRFISGYFSAVDTAGHHYGPEANETKLAAHMVDALIGQLMDAIASLDFDVNLIVVSDHGMTQIQQDKLIPTSALPISDEFVVENNGSQLHLYAKPNVSDNAIEAQIKLLQAQQYLGFRYMNSERRTALAMSNSDRTGDILLEAIAPAYFHKDGDEFMPGAHGFDPVLKDMGGLFVASGPAFKSAVNISEASLLEVYPLVAHIMELSLLAPVDGGRQLIMQSTANQN